MGNTISEDQSNEMISIMEFIMNSEYPVLDIGKKYGYTGYIDFITYQHVNSPVMKGSDLHGRPFFVIRGEITKSDGTVVKTLETFFKRYTDNSILWHGCGHDGPYFMSTEGGMNLQQMQFIKDLLTNGEMCLTEEIITNLRIGDYFIDRRDESYPKLLSIKLA